MHQGTVQVRKRPTAQCQRPVASHARTEACELSHHSAVRPTATMVLHPLGLHPNLLGCVPPDLVGAASEHITVQSPSLQPDPPHPAPPYTAVRHTPLLALHGTPPHLLVQDVAVRHRDVVLPVALHLQGHQRLPRLAPHLGHTAVAPGGHQPLQGHIVVLPYSKARGAQYR